MNREPGTYKARGVSMTLGASNNGTECVRVLFNLEAGGQEVWTGWLTEKALKNTLKALRVCGWQGDDLSDGRGIDTNVVYLVIDNEEYEGKTRARVQFVNETEHGPMMQKSGAEAKAMGSKWRAAIIAARQAEGNGGASAVNDDDIPF